MIELESYRQLLHEAATGEVPDRAAIAEHRIHPSERPPLERALRIVAALANAGGSRIGRRYADVLIDQAEEASQAADIADQVEADATMGSNRTGPGNLHTHPAAVVATGVAAGRPVPTREQLDELGFPTDIARATIEAAEVIAAASDAGGQGLASSIARQLGPRVAHLHPWPDPEDDWSDLAGDVARHQGEPPSAFDAEAIAARVDAG